LGGDFIQADEEYTAAQLGWTSGTITLYVEAVNEAAISEGIPIEFQFYPNGAGQPSGMAKDVVKMRPYLMRSGNPGFGDLPTPEEE